MIVGPQTRRTGAALCLVVGLGVLSNRRAIAASTIAVAEFDYVDTSGEVLDQSAEHARRLKILSGSIRTKLSKAGRDLASPMSCGQRPCAVETVGADGLLAAAKASKADYLVYGGVHKMSTLVQWMRVEMVDLATGKVVVSRLLTFRGDTDEAYDRAGTFVTDAVLQPLLQKP